MRVRRFGHSTLLVEAAGRRILIDPGAFSDDDAFAVDGLDAIVVTHRHPDHLDEERLPALLERNTSAVRLADPETAASVSGFTAHTDGDVTTFGELTVTGVGTSHAEILPSIARITNTGALITAPGEPTLFHPGDSYADAPPGVDVLAVPLSAPWAKVAETVDFVQRVAPRILFPIHDAGISPVGYGIYWRHVSTHGGAQDARQLGPRDSATLS